ncbi:MAG TPA: hypothetical protein VMT77_06645, partial [Gemmatimonadales bacterium]|nr:hypothetical protein [Gemmatimonadales bacterium]
MFAAGLLATAGCARTATNAAVPLAPSPDSALAAAAAESAAAAPESLALAPGAAVPALTLREKAAQLVMPWIPGDYWANDAAA